MIVPALCTILYLYTSTTAYARVSVSGLQYLTVTEERNEGNYETRWNALKCKKRVGICDFFPFWRDMETLLNCFVLVFEKKHN